MLTAMLVQLIGKLGEPETWIVLMIGGVGWLSGPLLLVIEGNAIYQALQTPMNPQGGQDSNQ